MTRPYRPDVPCGQGFRIAGKKRLEDASCILAIVAFLSTLSAISKADTFTIHYRPVIFPSFVFANQADPWIIREFPEAVEMLKGNEVASYYRLPTKMQNELNQLIFRKPVSWGHVVIELPRPLSDGIRIIGWRPKLSSEPFIEDLAQSLLEYKPGYLQTSPPLFEGAFFDETEWLADLESIVKPTKVRIALSRSDSEKIYVNIETIRRDGRFKYQLKPRRSNVWETDSYNCVSILSAIFADTALPLPSIPANGSVSHFDFAIRELAGSQNNSCSNIFLGTPTNF